MQNLGAIYELGRRYPEAEAIYRDTHAAQARVLGPDHPNTISSLEGIGIVLMKSGRYREAEQPLQEALARSIRVFGMDNLNPLAIRSNLAETYMREERFAVAEEMIRDTIERKKKVLGPDSPRTMSSQQQLASLLAYRHDYKGAHRAYVELADRARRVLPRGHGQRSDPLTQLAWIDFQQKLDDEAFGHLEDAFAESEGVVEELENDPDWRFLRDKPRFAGLAKKFRPGFAP